MAAAATLIAWRLIRSLYTLIDHATEADSARNPLAGIPYYWPANAAGILCRPLALWAGARPAGVRGNHLAIVMSTYVWATMTAGHLVDTTPSPWEAVQWVAIQSTAVTGASLPQAMIVPAGTQPEERSC
ncbi:hypothetical protein [Streptomyces gobitricini]|uniref:Integral membrane protein n=1 Tax=Streptomyces gobitricini TaxID=68211 RepID=A0ABN3MAA2_9ACTN